MNYIKGTDLRNQKTAEREIAEKSAGEISSRERDFPLFSMEGAEQGPPSATAVDPTASAGDPTASSPPLGDPVTGPDPATALDDVDEPEIHVLISDDDHESPDHDHDQEVDHHDEDHDRDHAAETVLSLDDLKLKIIRQASPLLPINNWRSVILSYGVAGFKRVIEIE